ncbi:hypothetical protein J4O75_31460 [Paenibacillus pabuli]
MMYSLQLREKASSDPEHLDQTAGNLFGGFKNPHLKASDWGWQIDPIGLRYSESLGFQSP